jgi:drug/metabolite transporter superfamily protein YnfA
VDRVAGRTGHPGPRNRPCVASAGLRLFWPGKAAGARVARLCPEKFGELILTGRRPTRSGAPRNHGELLKLGIGVCRAKLRNTWSDTRVDTAFAGRAYAAYGGIYIAASLVWLWIAEQQRPSSSDLIGAGLAIAGAMVIIGFAPKGP